MREAVLTRSKINQREKNGREERRMKRQICRPRKTFDKVKWNKMFEVLKRKLESTIEIEEQCEIFTETRYLCYWNREKQEEMRLWKRHVAMIIFHSMHHSSIFPHILWGYILAMVVKFCIKGQVM